MPGQRGTLAQRFWPKVDRHGPDECWPWLAAQAGKGYGWIGGGRERGHQGLYAHRVAWELAYGPIPEGLCVCHTCDNPACVNPAHLWLGTVQDNSDDMVAKGRVPSYAHRIGEAAHNVKLTEAQVREIRSLVPGHTYAELGQRFDVHWSTIGDVVRHRSWAHIA